MLLGVGAMVWCHICLSLSSVLWSHSTNFPYPGASQPCLEEPSLMGGYQLGGSALCPWTPFIVFFPCLCQLFVFPCSESPLWGRASALWDEQSRSLGGLEAACSACFCADAGLCLLSSPGLCTDTSGVENRSAYLFLSFVVLPAALICVCLT